MRIRNRMLAVLALPAALACGGEEAGRGAAEEAAPIEESIVEEPDPVAVTRFPEAIERDACALIDPTTVSTLTGADAAAGEVGDVTIETYGQRYTSCTFQPAEAPAVTDATFFGYELHHPADAVAPLRDLVFGSPDFDPIETLESAAVAPGENRAWAEVGETAIELRCGVCDGATLERAMKTLVENYRAVQ